MLTRKILIIDDETDFCLLLKAYFSRKKYDVYLSYSLNQGMKLLEEIKPDIIFLDNNLPDGFGWEKVEDIKKIIYECTTRLFYRFKTNYRKIYPEPVVFNKTPGC